MKKFTLALCATTTLLSSACTNTLYTHRKDFQPKSHGGAWNTEYVNLKHGERRARAEAAQGDNSHRPLWREGKWHDIIWRW